MISLEGKNVERNLGFYKKTILPGYIFHRCKKFFDQCSFDNGFATNNMNWEQ